jgi:hypothetical protein
LAAEVRIVVEQDDGLAGFCSNRCGCNSSGTAADDGYVTTNLR